MRRDRVSELDNDVLNQILLYLPTEESIRASVLSKRWRNLWLWVPGLDLKLSDVQLLERLLDNFLEINRGRLQKLKIDYQHDYLNDRFVDWIATFVDRGIQHLDVRTHNDFYAIDFMPHNIYKCKTLVSLKLAKVGLDNPKFVFSLPCLKIMHLENISYGENGHLILEKLISGCSVLEDLTVVTMYPDFQETLPLVRVRSQTLKIFHLRLSWIMFHLKKNSLEIDAAGLKYMSFRDNQSDWIVVKNLSSLVKTDLDTDFNLIYGDDLSKIHVICGFLTGISSVRHMIISQLTLEALYRYSELGSIPKFDNLSHLQAAFSNSSIQLLSVFLESCPNLKNLIMEMEPGQIDFTNVPRCLTSTLEYVEINKLVMKEESGIKLVNYFLENSAVLMKLKMSFIDSPMTNQESEIYKKLLTSTKLSPRCQVFVD